MMHCTVSAHIMAIGSRSVVIDTGAYSCKAGLAGQDLPSVIVPTLLGHDRRTDSGHSITASLLGNKNPVTGDNNCVSVGDEAFSQRGAIDLSFPVRSGIIRYWEGIEKIWRHIFEKELHVDAVDASVLMTDSISCPISERMKLTQVMFEDFQVSELHIAKQQYLSLYSTGLTTGTVLDCGEDITHAVTIVEGFLNPYTLQKVDIGGRDLTDYLMRLLNSSGQCSFSTVGDHALIRDIKEKNCYVPLEKGNELSSPNGNTYTLPDRTKITLSKEQMQCGEILFNPSLCGANTLPSLPDMVLKAINLNSEMHKDLYSNIVLSGGTSCLTGLPERLKKEMLVAARSTSNGSTILQASDLNVLAPNNRQYGVWCGGSIMASMPDRSKWITKAEYDESGWFPTYRKCN